MSIKSKDILRHSLLLLLTGCFLVSCETLPWETKDEEPDDKDKPIFTPVSPKPIKQESMEDEAITGIKQPKVDTTQIMEKLRPTLITPPPPPKKLPPFYEEYIKKSTKGKQPVQFAYVAESIHTIVPAFASVLGFSYTVDPAVQGAVTINVQGPDSKPGDEKPVMMSQLEIWKLFEQVLWMAGAYASPEGHMLHIMPFSKMPKEHRIFATEPPVANVVIRLVSVKNIAASIIIDKIQDFLSEGARASEVSGENSILLVESPDNIDKIMTLIEQLDKKERALWPKAIIRCVNVSASRIKSELESLLPVLGFDVTVDQMQPEPGSIHITSVERLQGLIVSAANKEAVGVVQKWVSILDRTDIGEQERVYVYKVVNSSASELLQALATIFTVEGTEMSGASSGGGNSSSNSNSSSSSRSSATRSPSKRNTTTKTVNSKSTSSSSDMGPANVFEIPVKIFADGKHNRLIIRTTPRTYATLKALLARIDSMPAQVLLQIMIAEATLNENSEFGLEFSGKLISNNKYLGLIGTQFSGLTPSSPKDSKDQGLQYYLQSTGSEDKFAYIRALAGVGNTKILSSPQILAVSGTEASLNVGRDIPTITSTVTDTTNTSTNNEVTYRKIGVITRITPVVTEGGLISMDVDQEVSQLGPNIAAGGSTYPSFLERRLMTTLAIRDGGTIIIGGIIDSVKQDNNQSAPWITKVPLLAKLLGYTTNKENRIELLMMITGTVVNEKTDLQKIIQRYKKAIVMFREMKKDEAKEPDEK